MPGDEWVTTRTDGRKVKFFCRTLPEGQAFLTAQIETNPVVYSLVLTNASNPLTREDVEGHFEAELLKK